MQQLAHHAKSKTGVGESSLTVSFVAGLISPRARRFAIMQTNVVRHLRAREIDVVKRNCPENLRRFSIQRIQHLPITAPYVLHLEHV